MIAIMSDLGCSARALMQSTRLGRCFRGCFALAQQSEAIGLLHLLLSERTGQHAYFRGFLLSSASRLLRYVLLGSG